MSMAIFYFKAAGERSPGCRIARLGRLTAQEAAEIRLEVGELLETGFDRIYLDARDVNEVDLSGVNELIHIKYLLENWGKKFVLIYRRQSVLEKWVETTGLDRFMETAILPFNSTHA